jgi:NAD(P)-dependent dehydrogenase (short-subunit alcohol dehydrogenase family)
MEGRRPVTARLQGKKVLVTGGGSGIGFAIAQRFLDEGATVAVCDRNAAAAAGVTGLGAQFSTCDVADTEALQSWVADSTAAMEGVDVVIAAAGYELVADALELTSDDWDTHLAVLLRGVFVAFRAALPVMLEAGTGSLIALGSNTSFAGLPRFTSYTTAKHGVIGLVRAMAMDFSARGVRVNALCPGPTMTPMIERQLVGVPDPRALLATWEAATMMNRLGTPEEIASAAVFLASDEASYVTGSALMVDGGYTAR